MVPSALWQVRVSGFKYGLWANSGLSASCLAACQTFQNAKSIAFLPSLSDILRETLCTSSDSAFCLMHARILAAVVNRIFSRLMFLSLSKRSTPVACASVNSLATQKLATCVHRSQLKFEFFNLKNQYFKLKHLMLTKKTAM